MLSRYARIGAFATAVAMVLGGILVGQSSILPVNIVPQAHAASSSGRVDYPMTAYPFGTYAPGAYAGPNTFTNPLLVEDDTVYTTAPARPGRIGKFTPDASGLITSPMVTPITGSDGNEDVLDWATAPWQDTIAVDGGGLSGEREKGAYLWGYYGVSYPPSTSRPPAGQPAWSWPVYWARSGATAPTSVFFVPQGGYQDPSGQPRQNDRGVGGGNWAGGEVDQLTGNLYFSGAECTNILGNFRMMIFDPATGAYNLSQKLVPNTPEDKAMMGTSTTDACAGNGYVSSDMAIDAQGNAYLMVISNVKSQYNPDGRYGYYLVKVTPGAPGNWRYSVVTWLDGTRGSATAYTYGMAFFNGYLYAYRYQQSTLLRINPITGDTVEMTGIDDISNGIAKNGNRGYEHDLASIQPAPVLTGYVYNDVGADGSVAGDPGVGGILVGLYDHNGALIGTDLTNSSGSYSFLMPGTNNQTFYARLIQPQMKAADGSMINAVQTYAAASAGKNTVSPQCLGTSLTGADGPCVGQLAAPYADPPVGAIGSVLDPTTMPVVTKVTMTTVDEVAVADFGITVTGSYGDAKAGPVGKDVPVHVNGVTPLLQFGAAVGSYPGPATDNSHTTDDGVYIDSYGGKLGLDGTIMAATRPYALAADVTGPLAPQAKVTAWVTNPGQDTWNNAPRWTPVVTGGKASGPFQYQPSGVVTGTPSAQLRANVSTAATTLPANTGGEYQAGATGKPSWTTPGEIEDYGFKVADAVVRSGAKTTSGTGVFTVAGNTITAGPDVVVSPVALGVSAGQVMNLTAAPVDAGWRIVDLVIRDTETGAEVAHPSLAMTGLAASFSYTPALASDVVIEALFAPDSDFEFSWTESEFSVSPVVDLTDESTWVAAGGTYTGTLTARDNRRNPVTDLPVAEIVFRASSTNVTVSDVVNHGDGTYTVTFTSKVALSDATAAVAVKGRDVGTDKPIPFRAGAAVLDCGGAEQLGRTCTNLSVDKAELLVGETSVATALVTDQYANPVSGQVVTFWLDPGSTGILSPVSGTTDADGKVYANLTDTKAETVGLNAKIAAGTIPPSPVSVRFGVGAVDPLKSHVSVDPAQQVAGSPVIVTVTVRDGDDNPIDNLAAADFALTGKAAGLPDLVFSQFTPLTDGTYTFQTTSRLAGTFVVRATVKSVLLADAPTATFIAGEVCVSRCTPEDNPYTDEDESLTHLTRILMTRNDQLADGIATDQARAYAFDSYGNAVAGAVFTVTDATSGGSAGYLKPGVTDVTTGADGTAVVEWSSTRAGTYTATTTVRSGSMGAGLEVARSDLNAIRFTPGNVAADKSTLQVAPAAAQQVDSSFTLKATIVDANNNPLQGVTVSFSSASAMAELSNRTCETVADGTCTAQVTSKLAGDYQVHATVSVGGVATDLGGGGDPGKASPQTVSFFAGPVCVLNCTPVDDPDTPEDESVTHFTRVEVDPDNAVADGSDRDTAVVWAYDRYGNAVLDAAVSVTTADPGLRLLSNSARTTTGGVARFDATSLVAGGHLASVTVAGLTPPGSPATLSFVTGPLGGVALSVSPSGSQPAGSVFTITATVTDPAGNRLTPVTVAFNLPAGLSAGSAGSCVTAVTGQCSIDVSATKAGSYPVTATAGAQTSNTVTVEFVHGPVDASMSSAVVTHDGEAFDGVSRNIVTVTVADRYGNPIPGAAVTSAGVAGQAGGLAVQPVIAATGADGQTTIWYTSTQPGPKKADVLIDGDITPAGSPVTLNFGNGTGDPGHSRWAITPNYALTVGTGPDSQFTATAVIRDVFDVPVESAVVSFTVDKPTTAWGAATQTCVTNAQGECSVTVTSTTSGTFAFTAAIPAGQIGQAQPAVWNPDAVCGPCSSVTVTHDNATADGSARDQVLVEAHDQYGNAVPGQLVASTSADPALVIQTGIGFTDALGQSTIWYSSKVAGVHVADVALGVAGVTPVGSPVRVTFVAGAYDPAQSRLTVTPASQDAGKPVTATADVRDANRNPIPGLEVTFGSTGQSERSADTCVSDNDGTCSITVTDNAAEQIQVSATALLGGQAVAMTGSPAVVTFKGATPPDAPVITSPKDGAVTNQRPLPVSGTGEPGAEVTVRDADGTTVCVTNVLADGSWVCPADLVDGPHTLVASQADPDGNRSGDSGPVRITVDTVAPEPPVIKSPGNGAVTNQRPLPVAGTGEPGAQVTVSDADGDTVCVTVVTGDGSWSCPARLDDGDHTLVASQTDPAGNRSGDSDPVRITVDTAAPNQPAIDGANKEKIHGTVPGPNDPGTVAVVTDSDTGKAICTAEVDATGKWSCDTPASIAKDTNIQVVAVDPAGNESVPRDGRLDVTAPEPPALNPSNGSEISGSTEPGASLVITDEDGAVIPGCGQVVADKDGHFVCTPNQQLRPGETVTVVSVDPAGNRSEPARVTVQAIVIEIAYPERHRLETQTVTGRNFNPGERVTLTVSPQGWDGETRTADAQGNVTFNFTVPGTLDDGTYTVSLTGAKSGQVSAAFSVTSGATVSTGGLVVPKPVIPLWGGITLLLIGVIGTFTGVVRLRRVSTTRR